jgi:hypothetical protein
MPDPKPAAPKGTLNKLIDAQPQTLAERIYPHLRPKPKPEPKEKPTR